MNTARYYSYETRNIRHRNALRALLKQHNVYYELSECFDAFYFEILATREQAREINDWLDHLE